MYCFVKHTLIFLRLLGRIQYALHSLVSSFQNISMHFETIDTIFNLVLGYWRTDARNKMVPGKEGSQERR